jgi:hypothetical protein
VALGAGDVLAVDDAELALVVADPELDVARSLEVRLHAEELGVPRPGRRVIGGEEVDRAQPAQR